MIDVNLSKDPTEYEGSHPRKEKNLALGSAVLGTVIGGLVFFLLFYIPTLFMDMTYATELVIVGTVVGMGVGASTGPLVSLRLSRLIGRKRGVTSRPSYSSYSGNTR